ncbi:hypothetical protein CH256_11260 [Rhodococcus sp. 05-2254-6]|nr:hypothetical protein CH256_11260 [Rhodococcus sp. 05-2254-6]
MGGAETHRVVAAPLIALAGSLIQKVVVTMMMARATDSMFRLGQWFAKKAWPISGSATYPSRYSSRMGKEGMNRQTHRV